MMAQGDWLRDLEVGEAGHDGLGVDLGDGNSAG